MGYELYKRLTKRQLEIAGCARKGFTDKEIANAFNISVFTVKAHLKKIYEKMEVSNRTELAGLSDWHEIKQREIEKETKKSKQSFNPEIVTYYEALLAEHIQADNLLGPRLVLNCVTHEATLLFDAVRATRGAERQLAIRLAAKYEEFLGWLYQDAGRLDLA